MSTFLITLEVRAKCLVHVAFVAALSTFLITLEVRAKCLVHVAFVAAITSDELDEFERLCPFLSVSSDVLECFETPRLIVCFVEIFDKL